MRTLKQITLVLALLAMASTAWAQAAVTSNDLMRLEATADEIGRQSATIRKTDATTAASIDKSLSDLRDDIAVLRVKLRRNGAVTQAEFSDVQTRLSILRAKAQNSVPAGAAAAPAPGPASMAASQPSTPTSTAAAPMTPRTMPQPSGSAPAPKSAPMPAAPMAGPATAADRVFLNVSFGETLSTHDVSAAFSFPLYDEVGTVNVARTVSGKALFDLTGGYRFNESMGVGVSFSTRNSNSDGAITASVPDPVAFDSPRSVTGTVPNMVHSEQWIAVLLAYIIPVGEKIDLMVLAGPAVAKLKHDLATSVAVTEGASGPVVAVSVTQIARSYVGFQVGADVQYFLMQGSGALKSLGVGGFVRYSRAQANLTSTVKLTLGGLQIGGGLRVRF